MIALFVIASSKVQIKRRKRNDPRLARSYIMDGGAIMVWCREGDNDSPQRAVDHAGAGEGEIGMKGMVGFMAMMALL